METFGRSFINRISCLLIFLCSACVIYVYFVIDHDLFGSGRRATYHLKESLIYKPTPPEARDVGTSRESLIYKPTPPEARDVGTSRESLIHKLTSPEARDVGTSRSKYVNTTNLSSVAVIEAECFPQKRILFLKTHKTGSSTMANIFFRYGDARNLTFALGDDTILGWPEKFHIFHPLRMFGKAPDILCSHARFNKEPMNWLFPRKTSKYVTILRNPVDNYESAFNFAQLGKSFGLGVTLDSLEKFLDKPIQSYSHSRKDIMMYLARNPMMFDLGLRFEYFQNLTAVKEYIQFLDNEFDLVMIMDYFDESLLLMKRLLCWKIEDILYVKLNERQDKEKATLLSARVKENIRRWNKADVLLFDYFNATFWRRVKKEGPSFYEELSTFRRRKQEIRQLCLIDGTRIQRAYHNKFVKGYSVRNDLDENSKRLCENFVRTENDFLAYLRRKRMVKLRESGIDKLDKIENEIGWQVAKDLQYDPVRT